MQISDKIYLKDTGISKEKKYMGASQSTFFSVYEVKHFPWLKMVNYSNYIQVNKKEGDRFQSQANKHAIYFTKQRWSQDTGYYFLLYSRGWPKKVKPAFLGHSRPLSGLSTLTGTELLSPPLESYQSTWYTQQLRFPSVNL